MYREIFRILTHLMPETYSKSFQISKMMKHIENPAIVGTVYSNIFRHIQGHSDIQGHWGTLRHIEALLRHKVPYSVTFRTMCNPYIYNRTMFRILSHFEPKASSKTCGRRKDVSLFKHLFSRILWSAGSPIQWFRVRNHWEVPRSTQPFFLPRLIKWVSGISGNLVLQSKLPPRSGSSLEAVETHS